MTTTTPTDSLKERAKALKLYGLLAHWDEVSDADWLEPLIRWEEEERARRGLQRRLSAARLGRFKPLADFDWNWPKQCDRQAVEELMQLGFLEETANAVLVGPNGVGKSTIARNIAHQAVLAGHSVLFTNAAAMLNELAAQDGDNALRRRLALYARPKLLVIDEIGYLSYSNRHADLLFAPLRGEVHDHHHQQTLRRMEPGLSQRLLRRLPGRPPCPPCRNHPHRR
jgi:DNA replication protein DnaC